MTDHRRLYLRPDVMVEPLFNQWYAWPLLISPASASMILTNLHLRILESFVKSPQIHRSAAKNPAMRGGPFMDYDGDPAHVQAMIDQTRRDLAPLIELSASIKELDALLQREATGGSLESLYPKIPPRLRGYVELGYDLYNQPSPRFIESLLYASPYYDPGLQSVVLSRIERDDRPFVLSTPRLEQEGQLHLGRSFDDPLLSELLAMKSRPGSEETLRQLADVERLTPAQHELLRSLFTETEPALDPERHFDGEGVRVRYFGHATVLIESRGVTLMTDPVVSYPVADGLARFGFEDLPDRLDYVLLTHSHQDHVMFETLLQIRDRIGTIVVPKNNGGTLQDPSLKLMLERLGFRDVVEVDEMQALPLDGGELVGLPFFGEHGDLHIRTKMAYYLRLEERTFLFAADSNNLEERTYEHVHGCVGDVEHVFIGMECAGAPMSWLYGPLFSKPVERKLDQERRLNGSNCARALGIVERFRPRNVYVYAMGQEPWLTYISSIAYTETSEPIVESNQLVETCRERGIRAERLYGRKVFMA